MAIVVHEREVARGTLGAILAMWLGVERRTAQDAPPRPPGQERRGRWTAGEPWSAIGTDAMEWDLVEPETEWLGI